MKRTWWVTFTCTYCGAENRRVDGEVVKIAGHDYAFGFCGNDECRQENCTEV